jgi:hypothetical protein
VKINNVDEQRVAPAAGHVTIRGAVQHGVRDAWLVVKITTMLPYALVVKVKHLLLIRATAEREKDRHLVPERATDLRQLLMNL